MKTIKILLSVLALSTTINIVAQEQNFTMLKDSTVWSYIYGSYSKGTYKYYNYIALGDTVIKDKTYKNIYAFSGDYNKQIAKYSGSLREENNRVYAAGEWTSPYFILDVSDGETLLYDFSLNLGDTFAKSSDPEEPINVRYMDMMEMADGQHKIYFLDGPVCGSWIEGVGSCAYNIFTACYPFSPGMDLHNLMEFVQNHTMLFNNNNLTLVKDNIHWIERESSEFSPDYTLTDYQLKGDTIISEKKYMKVYANGDYNGAIRMNSEHKVYYFKNRSDKEILLYDFDWIWGKEIHSVNDSGNDFILINSQKMSENYYTQKMTLLDGKEYDYRILTANPNPDGIPFNTLNKEIRLIKDIGLTSGIFSHVKTGQKESPGYNDLVSVYDGDKRIYLNPAFKENGELATSIETIGTGRKVQVTVDNGQAVFTLKDGISIPNSRLLIYAVDGKLITTRSLESGSASIGNLPEGVYYYRTEGGEGIPDNGKFLIE